MTTHGTGEARIMNEKAVCPYYGMNAAYCDVGCDYISPHDVDMIIRYCSCRYRECLKYQELVDRFVPIRIEKEKADERKGA
jgi:hypothetical protein